MFKPPNITQLFRANISGDGGGGCNYSMVCIFWLRQKSWCPILGFYKVVDPQLLSFIIEVLETLIIQLFGLFN